MDKDVKDNSLKAVMRRLSCPRRTHGLIWLEPLPLLSCFPREQELRDRAPVGMQESARFSSQQLQLPSYGLGLSFSITETLDYCC